MDLAQHAQPAMRTYIVYLDTQRLVTPFALILSYFHKHKAVYTKFVAC